MTKNHVIGVISIITCCLLLAFGFITITHAEGNRAYQVQHGSISGGDYRVETVSWQVSGDAGGGNYSLQSPVEPDSSSLGCCCTYLPCVPRQP